MTDHTRAIHWKGRATFAVALSLLMFYQGLFADESDIQFSPYPAAVLSSASTFGTISCSGGTGDIAPPAKVILQLAMDSGVACGDLLEKGYEFMKNHQNQQCYDSLQKFIETCPLWLNSSRAFGYMTAAVQGLQRDTSIWARYRGWLESVLYLNKVDPEYFCSCVEAISGTLYDSRDTTLEQNWKASNRTLAVWQWLLHRTTCDTSMLRRDYQNARKSAYEQWLNDTTLHLDTTLPSMKDLGLDSILNLHLGVNLTHSPYAAMLAGFSVSTNPFTSSTALLFDLDKMAYVRYEVYDELGRMLIGDGSGHSYEAGKHQIPIEMKSFATGAYYLRVSLGDGEVRTIKLVRKE